MEDRLAACAAKRKKEQQARTKKPPRIETVGLDAETKKLMAPSPGGNKDFR